jgi:hypothetical protein
VTETKTVPVAHDRLAPGDWSGGKKSSEAIFTDRTAGTASLRGRPVRAPFKFRGELWLCVGMGGAGGIQEAKAYRLVPRQMFRARPTTYHDKTAIEGGDAARNDPMGFYHGVSVKWGGETLILMGPPVKFVPDGGPRRPRGDAKPEAEQLNLF